MTIGEKIKRARKKAGLTQKQLGEKMGVSFQSIAQWENDLRNPKLDTLIRIAKALGVPVASLIPGNPVEIGFGLQGYRVDGKVFLTDESLKRIKAQRELTPDDLEKGKKQAEEIEAMLSEYEAEKNIPSELEILRVYRKLNTAGKKKAIERLEELSEIPKYTLTAESEIVGST